LLFVLCPVALLEAFTRAPTKQLQQRVYLAVAAVSKMRLQERKRTVVYSADQEICGQSEAAQAESDARKRAENDSAGQSWHNNKGSHPMQGKTAVPMNTSDVVRRTTNSKLSSLSTVKKLLDWMASACYPSS
jgi:hypothetical protein